MTVSEEEALSVLSQPTSCCDNVSDLGRDNTPATGDERAVEVKKLNDKSDALRLLQNPKRQTISIIFLLF